MKLNTKQLDSAMNDESTMIRKAKVGSVILSKDDSHVWGMCWKDHHSKCRSTRNYIYRYIRKNVGRPYDDVFHEFCEMGTRGWNGWDLFYHPRSMFNDMIDDSFDIQNHNDFYKDESGIIRYRKSDKPAHHKDRVFVADTSKNTYTLKESLRGYRQRLFRVLCSIGISRNIADKVLYDTFDESIMKHLRLYTDYTTRTGMHCYPLEKELDDIQRGWEHGVDFSYYCRAYGVVYMFDVNRGGQYVTKTKSERIKATAEAIKKHRKVVRDTQKVKAEDAIKEARAYMEEKKRKEREENLIKIQAHGMDDATSFRGEAYHGEKRKKKKDNEKREDNQKHSSAGQVELDNSRASNGAA